MYFKHKLSIIIGLVSLALIPLIAMSQGGISKDPVVETERTVDSFSRIASNGSTEVRIHKSTVFRVVVVTMESLQEQFEVKTTGGLLSLGFRSGTSIWQTTRVVVDVYLPELESLAISGLCRIRYSGDPKVDSRIAGTGTVRKIGG